MSLELHTFTHPFVYQGGEMFSIHIHRYSEQVPGSYGESWIGMTNSWWYKARCRCGKIKHVKRFSEIERW